MAAPYFLILTRSKTNKGNFFAIDTTSLTLTVSASYPGTWGPSYAQYCPGPSGSIYFLMSPNATDWGVASVAFPAMTSAAPTGFVVAA